MFGVSLFKTYNREELLKGEEEEQGTVGMVGNYC